MLSVEEFKQQMNSKIKPDDVIKVILGYTTGEKIIKEPSIIHKAIYRLSKQDNWKPYLKDFYFNVSGISPFSYQLDQVLSRLETACLLSTPNPSYDSYVIKKPFLQETISKFDSKEHENMKAMAIEFETYLN